MQEWSDKEPLGKLRTIHQHLHAEQKLLPCEVASKAKEGKEAKAAELAAAIKAKLESQQEADKKKAAATAKAAAAAKSVPALAP
eukprot:1446250-Pleurochrysis_carterae.AAC.1